VGKHHWRRVVVDPAGFELGLLAHLHLDPIGLADLIRKMRQYRDGFIAHLDDGRVMDIPELGAASAAVSYYHRYVVEREVPPEGIGYVPTACQFALSFGQCAAEAARVFSKVI
jgi:hypothetical protein